MAPIPLPEALGPNSPANNGKRVFIYESKATTMCLSKGIIHRNLETVCDEVKENLVSADTQLAETALIEAKAAEVQNPDNQPCYEQMIRLAEKAIEHAEKKKDKLPAVAITHYMQAWEFSQKAIKIANSEKRTCGRG